MTKSVARPSQRTRAAAGVLAAALVGLVLLVAPPARAWAADAAESITAYDTQLAVDPDGSMRVVETIDYDFGSNARHGIIRQIPATFRYDDTRDRVYPISGITVTVDGGPVPSQRSTEGGDEVIKIGDEDRTITGRHRYVIAYTVRGALNDFADHEELYWNAIGDEWSVPIAQATATVTTPVDITQVACFAGPAGSRLGCATASASGREARFAQPNLAANAGLSVVLGFPHGSIGGTGPILVERQDLAYMFRATTATVTAAIAVTVLGVAAIVALLWLVGRDRRYAGQLPGLAPGPGEAAVETRKPLFGGPPVSVEFVPPDKIRPGQVGTLIDEQANVLDVTATILDFAVRRHLLIKEIGTGDGRGRDWELTKLTDGDPAFLPYERALFDALFAGRDSVLLLDLKNTFATDLAGVQKQLYADMIDRGWYRRNPATTRAWARGIAIGVFLASGLATFLLALLGAGLVGLGLIAVAGVLLAFAGRFPARTGRGSAMLARVQGFRLYIATAEAEQIKFQEREQIFSAYLPYAIVFGLADRWAGIFADLGSTRTDGSAGLYWYAGAIGWTMGDFDRSMGSFTSTTVGTIATTPAASGASGFSGGGFSGGGGGGGGGGSW